MNKSIVCGFFGPPCTVESSTANKCNKLACMAFGPMYQAQISDISLGLSKIAWQSNVKYIGLTSIFGSCFKVDIDVIKGIFVSCNAVLHNSMHQLDLLRLQLSESYCVCASILPWCYHITFSNRQL